MGGHLACRLTVFEVDSVPGKGVRDKLSASEWTVPVCVSETCAYAESARDVDPESFSEHSGDRGDGHSERLFRLRWWFGEEQVGQASKTNPYK